MRMSQFPLPFPVVAAEVAAEVDVEVYCSNTVFNPITPPPSPSLEASISACKNRKFASDGNIPSSTKRSKFFFASAIAVEEISTPTTSKSLSSTLPLLLNS
jgi:hypothetical protein